VQPDEQPSNAWWWDASRSHRGRRVARFLLKSIAAIVMIAVTILVALFIGGMSWQWKPATYLARILILPAVVGGLVVWVLANALIEHVLPLPANQSDRARDKIFE
jgi:hypothetical protein